MNSRSGLTTAAVPFPNRAADECVADAVGKVRADTRALSAQLERMKSEKSCDQDMRKANHSDPLIYDQSHADLAPRLAPPSALKAASAFESARPALLQAHAFCACTTPVVLSELLSLR